MSLVLAGSLDLNLAWRRLLFDRPDRVFTSHPFLRKIIELDLEGWLERIHRGLVDNYNPVSCSVFFVPKGNWQVRPGNYLRLDDELVYNSLVGNCYRNISDTLQWSQGDPDIAYQLNSRSDAVEWVRRGFPAWSEWRIKSMERANRGAEYILFADICGYYENIDIERLSSDLRSMHIDAEVGQLISQCLNRWAGPRKRGIPQGYSASDILAKVYLEPVDRIIREEGYDYLRYVDDIRIFCKNSRQAKRALLRLTELLKQRGLNLQSAKTEIVRIDQAIIRMDGVTPVIRSLLQNLQAEVRASYDAGSYATIADLELLVETHPDRPPLQILEQAFREHYLIQNKEFDKTLFHFLLVRLGAVSSEYAREYCIGLISQKPEETEAILRYLARIDTTEENQVQIIAYLSSEDSIYEFQIFQVLRHFYDHELFSTNTLQFCGKIIQDGRYPPWVKNYAMAILGESGNPAYLEQLESLYHDNNDPLSRAAIICSSYRMELRRRNSFLGRVKDDGWIENKAVRWVMTHR